MNNKLYNYQIETLYVIVNKKNATHVMNIAKRIGINGATTLYAKGTFKHPLLELLAINQSNKELVIIIAEKERLKVLVEFLNITFNFNKKNHGVAFTIPMKQAYGLRNSEIKYKDTRKEESCIMYNAIFVIVEKGNGELVVEASNKAGGRGATIINARGSGSKDTKTIFSIEIEPEKEMVLILAEQKQTDAICESIRKELEIDKPGRGIIFVQETSKVYGLNTKKK
jgi:nitrogen regulatory protein PII